MPNNGADTLTDVEKTIYEDEDGCTSFSVKNKTDSAVNALICVESLHGSEWFVIEPGDAHTFRSGDRGITKVNGKTASGTANIYKGVVAITD